jgi:hypothetical protein
MTVKLLLAVHYPNDYPDGLPDLKLSAIDGEISESELETLVEDLISVVRYLGPSESAYAVSPYCREMRTSEWP